jgi:hypothetical protein
MRHGGAMRLTSGPPRAQVFINPIVWEFVLVVSRILARALAHVHESVLPCLPAIVMSMKKMLGRFVIGLIEDPTLVLWASILLGIAEFLQITSLAVRDKVGVAPVQRSRPLYDNTTHNHANASVCVRRWSTSIVARAWQVLVTRLLR